MLEDKVLLAKLESIKSLIDDIENHPSLGANSNGRINQLKNALNGLIDNINNVRVKVKAKVKVKIKGDNNGSVPAVNIRK